MANLKLKTYPIRAVNFLVLVAVTIIFNACETFSLENFSVPHPSLSLVEFRVYVKAGKVPILDARDEQSYEEGHVPHALCLLSDGNFFANYEKLEKILAPHKKRLVIVYCSDRWCGRADDLQAQLIARGFQHVAIFPGGWMQWQQANLPVEKGSVASD